MCSTESVRWRDARCPQVGETEDKNPSCCSQDGGTEDKNPSCCPQDGETEDKNPSCCPQDGETMTLRRGELLGKATRSDCNIASRLSEPRRFGFALLKIVFLDPRPVAKGVRGGVASLDRRTKYHTVLSQVSQHSSIDLLTNIHSTTFSTFITRRPTTHLHVNNLFIQ